MTTISDTMKRLWADPEYRKMMHDAMRDRHSSQKFIDLMKSNSKKISDSPAIRKKMSEKATIRALDPVERKRRSDYTTNLWKDPEYRNRQKEIYTDPAFRKKKSDIITEKFNTDPIYKQKIGVANRNKAKDPIFRNKLSKSIKEKYATDPAYCEKRRGENSSSWKGGLTSLYLRIRGSAKYSEWRLAVFKRDNFCDWFSGCQGSGNIVAHHIVPFSTLLEQFKILTFEQAMECEALWDINNGVTMFNSSHAAYHSMLR